MYEPANVAERINKLLKEKNSAAERYDLWNAG